MVSGVSFVRGSRPLNVPRYRPVTVATGRISSQEMPLSSVRARAAAAGNFLTIPSYLPVFR